jgi:hypothetical protein
VPVERFFAWIQWHRRILVRGVYHAHNFLGFVKLACLVNDFEIGSNRPWLLSSRNTLSHLAISP